MSQPSLTMPPKRERIPNEEVAPCPDHDPEPEPRPPHDFWLSEIRHVNRTAPDEKGGRTAGFLFGLETTEVEPADPPTLSAALRRRRRASPVRRVCAVALDVADTVHCRAGTFCGLFIPPPGGGGNRPVYDPEIQREPWRHPAWSRELREESRALAAARPALWTSSCRR
jgi:hypothetical protein